MGDNTVLHDDIVYGRTALRTGVPWITPESLEKIETLIKPEWLVFEWGSGGSTVYWGRRCTHVTSIEHNSEWVGRTSKMLLDSGTVPKVSLIYVGRDKDANTYNAYADTIIPFPGETFDLVFVDGEASCRWRCIQNAMPKVKPGGILLLDNSDWLKQELGPGWTREDYVVRGLKWIGQPGTFNWWTSIFYKQI